MVIVAVAAIMKTSEGADSLDRHLERSDSLDGGRRASLSVPGSTAVLLSERCLAASDVRLGGAEAAAGRALTLRAREPLHDTEATNRRLWRPADMAQDYVARLLPLCLSCDSSVQWSKSEVVAWRMSRVCRWQMRGSRQQRQAFTGYCTSWWARDQMCTPDFTQVM